MDDFLSDLEFDLDELATSLLQGPELAEEYREDLLVFTGSRDSDFKPDPATLRRHQEWFLLERECRALGAVPLESALELRVATETDRALRYAALRSSRAGIFKVARVQPGEGLLLDELLGRGQYVVDEPGLAGALQPDDLIVGRIFPRDLAGQGERTGWCLSSAAANLRSPELLAALERDLEVMRGVARGPLRMTQSELEVMFFSAELREPAPVVPAPAGGPAGGVSDESVPVATQLDRMRSLLVDGGFPEEAWSDLVEVLRASPMPAVDLALGGDDPLGWILSEVAFETELELEPVRAGLASLWRALHQGPVRELAGTAERPDPGEDGVLVPQPSDVAAALERFDAGRAAGVQVEDLFAALEAELGLEAELESDDHLVPDFPGVLGALVQEYLWDGARLEGEDLDAFVARNRELELLVQFGSFLGVPDELGLDHLRVFLGRWLWEQVPVLAGDRDLGALAACLGAFLAWLDEHHGHAVGEPADDMLAIFQAEQARILGLNQRLAEAAGDLPQHGETVTWEYLGPRSWLDQIGDRIECPLEPRLEGLAVGDFVVGQRSALGFVPRLVLPPITGPHTNASS